MAYPTVTGRANYANGAATSHAIPLPADIVSGSNPERLFIWMRIGGATGVPEIAGWTLVNSLTAGGGFVQIALFSRVADGTEGSTATVTFTNSMSANVSASSWKTAHPNGTPILDENAVASNSSVWSNPGVTTLNDECIVFYLLGGGNQITDVTWDNATLNTNENSFMFDHNDGTSRWVAGTFKEVATAGASGAESYTQSIAVTAAIGNMAVGVYGPAGGEPPTTETLRPDVILENTEPAETPAGRSDATLLTDLIRDVP